MSWLLFLDESGHDHRKMPYEVRGGIALHAGNLWPFVQAMKNLEVACFGDALYPFGSEVKGHRLLDKERFKWAQQGDELPDDARRKHARSFLIRGTQKDPEKGRPTAVEFIAYGQACLKMALGLFELLESYRATLFASAIPRRVKKPKDFKSEEYLRKDQVFLLERFFYFLEEKNEYGLIVMDETEKTVDRRFVRQLTRYFTATETGRYRTARIVPSPFFVSSDMTYSIQAADVCIYCINHGFRIPYRGMDEPVRKEIQIGFGQRLNRLQFRGEGYKDGETYKTFGIVFVPDPYTAR